MTILIFITLLKPHMDLSDENLLFIVKSFIQEYGFTNHIISSINDAYDVGLSIIIKDQYIINEVYRTTTKGNKQWTLKSTDLESVNLKVKALDVTIAKPTIYINGKYEPSYPNRCQKEERLYGSPLEVEYLVELEAITHSGKSLKKEPIKVKASIGRLPTVVLSNRCNLENKTSQELDRLEEDPNEFGGYIVNGSNRYLIDSVERTNAFNRVNTYYEGKHGGLLAWSNIISKPGIAYENSNEIIVRTYLSGEINIMITKDYFKQKEIPFFVIFRLLGVSDDRDIMKYILKDDDIDSLYNRDFTNMILLGFDTINKEFEDLRNLYDPIEIKDKLARLLVKTNNRIKLEVEMFDWLDANLFPHMGNQKEDRFKKVMFLGYMIKKTLLVALNPSLHTSRDQLEEKLVQPPGTLFCDTFKTLYNKYFIMQVKKKFEEKLKQAEFDNINLKDVFDVIIKNTKLESKLITTLSSGTKDPEGTSSRYSTQKLYNTPDINRLNASRTIRVASSSAHGKKTRSHAVRESKPSYAGYIDMTMSHDTGDNVGKIKGFGIMCLVTNRGDLSIRALLLKDILTMDQANFNLNQITGKGEVFLNGELLGYHDNICALRNKYVKLRRERIIDRFTGIHCHVTINNIDFRTDASRLIRPFLIVYNNFGDDERGLVEPKKENLGKFSQFLKFTKVHYEGLQNGSITIDDLVDEGIMEWIDCREFVYSTYIANSLETLIANKNNPLERFTHCEIMCSLYGVACLTQRFANHNPDVRTCFQAKMVKQTVGIPTTERSPVYKDIWRQAINNNPLTTTIMNEYVTPSGYMSMIAIMSYYGHNQEDSLIANQRTMDRGIYYVIVDDILEYSIDPNEFITNPDESITDNIKKAANYGKLVNGLVAKGVTISTGDVLISKRVPNKRTDTKTNKKFTDTSVRYKGTHDQLVLDVFDVSNENGRYIKIQVRERRPLRIGDKMSCYTADHDVLTFKGWKPIAKCTLNDKVACMKNGELVFDNPLRRLEYDVVDHDMYEVDNKRVNLKVTYNHNLYIRAYTKTSTYDTFSTGYDSNVFHKVRCYKNNVNEYYPAKDPLGQIIGDKKIPMEIWAKFIGTWYANGRIKENCVLINTYKTRVIKYLEETIPLMGFNYTRRRSKDPKKDKMVYSIPDINLANYLRPYSVGDPNKSLPRWVWTSLTRENSILMIEGMLNGNGHMVKGKNKINDPEFDSRFWNGTCRYDTSSEKLADDFQRLCLQAGWSAYKALKYNAGHINKEIDGKPITQKYNAWRLTINKNINEPRVNKHTTVQKSGYQDMKSKFTGKVYCLEVPHSHIIYVRRKGIPVWCGNSSSGQKGIISKIYPNHLMPFTADGVTPDFLMGPHAFPSRKTIGQLLEGLYSTFNAMKGIISDHTVFTKIDVHAMMDNIKKYNVLIDKRIMYNGVTGEKMEVPIVLIPNYYQRIHKSIYDSHYAIYSSDKDPQTRQAKQGQKQKGGIRFGEMESQASSVSGACAQLKELFTDNSDGFVTYVCRCGSRDTIVNEEKKIYSCLRCNSPSIVKLNDGFTSNISNHNLTGMGLKLTFDIK